MNERDSCAALRPLLSAAIDGEVDRAERLELNAHLAICDGCRSWERSERALTALLVESRPAAARSRARSRLFAFAGALAAASALLLLLPSAAPRASLVERHLGPACDWQVSGERELRGSDVIDVPAAGAITVRLLHVAQLEAVGPARLAFVRTGSRWRVDVLAGAAAATVAPDAALAVGAGASQQLGGGHWLVTPTRVAASPAPLRDPVQDPIPTDTESLLAEGLDRFQQANVASAPFGGLPDQEQTHLVAAERLLRAVLAANGVTKDQERRASFYLAASVSRQGRDKEAFGMNEQWLTRHPDGAEASSVRFYMADHLRKQGQAERARALFEQVLRDEGDAPLGRAARVYLDMMDAPPQQPDATRGAPQDPGTAELTATRAPAKGGGAGGYLVVQVGLDPARDADKGFVAAALAARTFHHAAELVWDGRDFVALEQRLRELQPENVLFVVRPEQLDLVLHRRVLLLCSRIDDDWFADFAFGWLTGEDGKACERTWQRIAELHAQGKLGGTWWQGSVTSNKTSLEYENAPPELAATAGFRGPHYYWSTKSSDRDAMVAKSLATMAKASVVEITGCGDPQGIWLFDDQRNMQHDKHWDYAPELVGRDPNGEMPRLLAKQFRSVPLASPVLWSGTCHSGAVCRVFVEGDIVSTFGRTKRVTVHELAPKDSLALSWLAAGAASMLVPLGANHGMSVSMEVDFALRNGSSLGETMKSTYDDVLLAAKGELVLDLPHQGGIPEHHEQVMQGGGANRILLGDPALRPFGAVAGGAEVVKTERTDAGVRVTVVRTKGFQPRAWDMYGVDRDRDWRVLARVDLGALGLADKATFTARVSARGADGATLPYTMQRVAIEDHCGRRYLHVQCNAPRKQVTDRAGTIVFDVVAK